MQKYTINKRNNCRGNLMWSFIFVNQNKEYDINTKNNRKRLGE